ncbi:unnamed protein product [Arctogadus glacialis]
MCRLTPSGNRPFRCRASLVIAAKRWCKSHPDWLTAFGSGIPSIPSEVGATSPGSPSSHVLFDSEVILYDSREMSQIDPEPRHGLSREGRYQATTHRPPNQWRGLQRKARVAFCGSNGRWSSGGQGRRSRRVPPKHSGGGLQMITSATETTDPPASTTAKGQHES